MKHATKTKPKMGTRHEIIVQLSGFTDRLLMVVEQNEGERLTGMFDMDRQNPVPAFYEIGMSTRGGTCFINTAEIEQILVIDQLTGLPLFPQSEEQTLEQYERDEEERNQSNDIVALRFHLRAQAEIKQWDVSYNDWVAIWQTLNEEPPQFINFTDDDGDTVILPTSRISAIEAFDSHYIPDEEIEKLLAA